MVAEMVKDAVVKAKGEKVDEKKKTGEVKRLRNPKKEIRRELAKAYRKKKFVVVAGSGAYNTSTQKK